jgi:5'-phosphate synthase pdxT subunit
MQYRPASAPLVGVLAVQGAFAEHVRCLESQAARCVELRTAADCRLPIDALVLPGGESTVQSRLLAESGMLGILRERIGRGLPVLGTCAGLILLARTLEGGSFERFGTLPVVVARNAYGRQLDSFRTEGVFAGEGAVPMTFIRAPRIVDAGSNVETLAQVSGFPVAVRFGAQLGLAFHPEVDDSPAIHRYFLDMVEVSRAV